LILCAASSFQRGCPAVRGRPALAFVSRVLCRDLISRAPDLRPGLVFTPPSQL
jgi:hypothetical protein